MNLKYYFFFFLISVASLQSCKKFLDAKPDDKYTEEEVFKQENTIQQTLNGIYYDLADNNLYGAALTSEAIEILARRYNINSTLSAYASIRYNYNEKAAAGTTFDNIWTKAYNTILKTNKFIEQLEQVTDNVVLSQNKRSILLGEAYAIRAFLHFDLLRIYGPSFADNPSGDAIPYYTSANGELQPVLAGDAVIEKVLADYNHALELLAQDAVIAQGVVLKLTGDVDFYGDYRNRRLNYYAVKGLLARTLLYSGNRDAAYGAAKEVLDQGEQWFPWLDYGAIVGAQDPDRVFSTEVLFGINNPNMYTNQSNYFSATQNAALLLAPVRSTLDEFFEWNENDYRYTTTWFEGPSGFRTFYKYADVQDINQPRRYFQPLLRKSELYYIVAETAPDPLEALQYLNTVRYNRGLSDLAEDADLATEIGKEYQKEFFGEGQLFFYYKRTGAWMVLDGNGDYDYDFNPNIPLPFSETELR